MTATPTHLFRHTASFHRKSPARDGSGGAVENYADVVGLTAVPCLVQPHSGKAARQHGERQVLVSHVLYLADAGDVRRGDRVYWEDGGVYFHVVGLGDMAGQDVCARIELTLVT